jgi:hypothetical protein
MNARTDLKPEANIESVDVGLPVGLKLESVIERQLMIPMLHLEGIGHINHATHRTLISKGNGRRGRWFIGRARGVRSMRSAWSHCDRVERCTVDKSLHAYGRRCG